MIKREIMKVDTNYNVRCYFVALNTMSPEVAENEEHYRMEPKNLVGSPNRST